MTKNKLYLFTILIAALALVIPACGGGGGGGGGLPDGTFIKTLQLASNNPWTGPIYSTTWTDWRVQTLGLADAIDGSGYITSIAFKAYDTTSTEITCPDITIKMGHTSLSALTNTFASNVEEGKGTLETVLTNAQVVVPVVSSGDYFEIQLETPFYYNGVDNLVVDFIRTGFCDGDLRLYSDNTFSNGSLWTDTLANPTGNLDIPLNMEFQFEGGTNTVISADKTGDNGNNIAPGYTGRTQMLLLAEHIDGSGPITGLSIFPTSITTATEISNISVSMVHVTATSLTATFADNYGGSTPVVVAQDVSYSIPAGQSAAVWIPFNVANFTYDGTSNLLIDISATVSSGGYTVDYKDVPDIRVVSDGAADATTGTTRSRAFEPVLRFNGGTIDTFTAGNTADPYPFTNDNQRQYLYRASELGTGGTINKLALRAKSDSVASDYANFTVMLGHTSAVELTSTFADNMDDATTVFSGLFSISLGLKAGDWIEIPLTSSFTYNGEDNLVVYMGTDGGSATNIVFAGGPDSLYTNRHSFVGDNTSPAAGDINNHLVDQRLWLQ